MTRLAFLLGFLALPALAQPPSPAPPDAVQFVRSLYALHYKNQGFGDADLPVRKEWFTPELYALLLADTRRDPDGEDPPRLAFDPFTRAQEDADRFTIGRATWQRERAHVDVDNYFGKTRLRVTLRLVQLDGKWRIENIIYSRRFNLVGILSTRE